MKLLCADRCQDYDLIKHPKGPKKQKTYASRHYSYNMYARCFLSNYLIQLFHSTHYYQSIPSSAWYSADVFIGTSHCFLQSMLCTSSSLLLEEMDIYVTNIWKLLWAAILFEKNYSLHTNWPFLR